MEQPKLQKLSDVLHYLSEVSLFFLGKESRPEIKIKVDKYAFDRFCEDFIEYSWREYGHDLQRIMGRTKAEDSTVLHFISPLIGQLTIYYEN